MYEFWELMHKNFGPDLQILGQPDRISKRPTIRIVLHTSIMVYVSQFQLLGNLHLIRNYINPLLVDLWACDLSPSKFPLYYPNSKVTITFWRKLASF